MIKIIIFHICNTDVNDNVDNVRKRYGSTNKVRVPLQYVKTCNIT